ncbi:transformer 2 beta [Halocaridina rubra]|uniref:Transformer 2 beta n=1 Tax=Halocaridina rubra TaxID=373956 RepID=A0AAN8ZQS7_HALRR
MESPEVERRSHSPQSRSRSRSRLDSASPRRTSHSRSPRRRSYSRSRSRTPRRHRSRSGSARNGHSGSRSYSRRSRYDPVIVDKTSPMSNRRRHIGTRDNPEPSKCLGVFGLSVYTTERQLHQIFDKFGPLEKVQVVLDSKSGKSRGFAFVYFESMKDAADAKDECSGMEIDGRRIRVDFSITKRPHTPTPGIYMGRPTSRRGGGYDRNYNSRGGGGGGGGGGRDRYRSPSPRYKSRNSGRRDYYDRGYERDRYDRGYDRNDRGGQYHDRYDRYDRSYDKYDRYERSRSRSYSPRK